jgi:hypothetical protein
MLPERVGKHIGVSGIHGLQGSFAVLAGFDDQGHGGVSFWNGRMRG